MQPKSNTKRLETQRKHHHHPITPPPPPPPPPSTPLTNQTQNQIQTQFLNHPFFPFGSRVEVTSDEEGFKGAWYLATVIPPPSFSSSSSSSSSSFSEQEGKIFVEYKNLLSDENGSTLLKELVESKFVRPIPPVNEDDKNSFELNDVVDAFYQDGWWCGVVARVVSDTKYRVLFSNPPDEMEFQSSDLRIHKDWVDGIWVLPEKQRMRDLKFSTGTAVEVNIDPDNSCDVWLPATFIKQVAGNSFLVEYQRSKEAGFQKVAVDSLHIRPSPPSSSSKGFNLLEKVDALCDYRWLSGVVTKILAEGRYIIYFKHTKKEKELSHADLRLHMEWSNGKWIHSSQDTSVMSNSEKRTNQVNGGNKEKLRALSDGSDDAKGRPGSDKISFTNLKSCQKELQMPGNEKGQNNSTTPSNKRIKKTSVNGDYSYSRPLRKSNDDLVSDVLLSPETCKSKMNQMEGSNDGTSLNLDCTPGGPGESNMKQSQDSSQPSDPTEFKEDYEKHSSSRKRGRPPKLRALLSGDARGETADQTLNKSDVVKSFGPIVIGLTHNGKMIGSLGESSNQHLKLEHKKVADDDVDSSVDHGSVVSNGSEQQREGEVTNLKRKRGRPPKILFRLGSPKANETEEGNKDDASNAKDDASVAKDDASDAEDDDGGHSPTGEVEKPVAVVEPSGNSDSAPASSRMKHMRKISDQMKVLSDIRRLSTRSTSKKQGRKQRKVPTETVLVDINESLKPVLLKKGRRQKSNKHVELPIEDAEDNSRMRAIEVFNNGVARDVDRAVAGTSNASDDDRPLSAWFEGAHSPPATDAKISPIRTVGQSCESGEREDEIRTASVAQPKEKEQHEREFTLAEVVSQERDKNVPGRADEIPIQSQSAIILMEDRDLPFVKNSLIWGLIENMEVLKQIPQNPHFRPLYNCKEECREGLAIGSMVTFTSLVERISKTSFSDPKSLLDGYLEALVDLEELGFSVAPVREQLNRLISIKVRHEQAQNTSKEIEVQIMDCNHEKSIINEEIAELDKKIAELKEKRALALLKKERNDTEITLLQTSVDAVKNTLEGAEQEFENIATSLW